MVVVYVTDNYSAAAEIGEPILRGVTEQVRSGVRVYLDEIISAR